MEPDAKRERTSVAPGPALSYPAHAAIDPPRPFVVYNLMRFARGTGSLLSSRRWIAKPRGQAGRLCPAAPTATTWRRAIVSHLYTGRQRGLNKVAMLPLPRGRRLHPRKVVSNDASSPSLSVLASTPPPSELGSLSLLNLLFVLLTLALRTKAASTPSTLAP
ncbi:hypothetical protein BU26DRAFT_176214 [Trematosphaeria pertusa]|uniref:Uncharacterized protein n=1 Tax=Trematosphaeria pertusa TaxID=390896 RepID=A0A6A6HTI2_9PLEO|nr:uncharacterized protein BU26DRAFT_176214 [Trematosphaeria pertusa]KAF2241327.1 hypothetical protein BU26DRAFT_176214 [Trematosphaeria pertusa]